ncbi:hypothetical protein PC113_g20754 [Phytophthora cactorum]|uniref:Uncharacterized protein n=1 Tax=Phytophthora cactorum TaxID=29920 RepID=A0A8T0Y7L6_9STRA|nr:hypothetical protein PC113_g20754 [Phytophthora cactorum]
MTESALIVTQAKDGVESGGRDRVQDVTWEAGVNASEEKATATDPVVLRNVCVGLEEKDVEVPEEFGLGAGKSVPLQWRSVELEGIGETGAYRKLPPLCDKDEPEGIAESGLRYYLQNEGCTDNEVERVVESARRYYEMEALAVRAKVRERRQRREEMTDQGNRRALGTVTFQGAEESVFELYTAGEESEGKVNNVYSISANGIPLLSRRSGLQETGDREERGEPVVPDGKRVICRIVALCCGYVDCCPTEMLVDTVWSRV